MELKVDKVSNLTANDKKALAKKIKLQLDEIVLSQTVKEFANSVLEFKSKGIINDFDTCSEFSPCHRLCNEIKEMAYDIRVEQLKPIVDQLSILTTKIHDYEVMSQNDIIESKVNNLVKKLIEIQGVEVKDAKDIDDVLHRLSCSKSNLETLASHKSLKSFVQGLKPMSELAEVESFKELETSVREYEFNSNYHLSNAIKDVSSKIEWYTLLKSIHAQLTNESGFDKAIMSFKDRINNQSINELLDILKLNRYHASLTSDQIVEINDIITGVDPNQQDLVYEEGILHCVANFIRLSTIQVSFFFILASTPFQSLNSIKPS